MCNNTILDLSHDRHGQGCSDYLVKGQVGFLTVVATFVCAELWCHILNPR
jgi:hypothetical protein